VKKALIGRVFMTVDKVTTYFIQEHTERIVDVPVRYASSGKETEGKGGNAHRYRGRKGLEKEREKAFRRSRSGTDNDFSKRNAD